MIVSLPAQGMVTAATAAPVAIGGGALGTAYDPYTQAAYCHSFVEAIQPEPTPEGHTGFSYHPAQYAVLPEGMAPTANDSGIVGGSSSKHPDHHGNRHSHIPSGCYDECSTAAAVDYTAAMFGEQGSSSVPVVHVNNEMGTHVTPYGSAEEYYEAVGCRVKQEQYSAGHSSMGEVQAYYGGDGTPPPVYYPQQTEAKIGMPVEFYAPPGQYGSAGVNRDGGYYTDSSNSPTVGGLPGGYYTGSDSGSYNSYNTAVEGIEYQPYAGVDHDGVSYHMRMAQLRGYEESMPPGSTSPHKYSQMYGQASPLVCQGQGQHRMMESSLLCAVCGDNAACQHYGVRTCEGCKGFFKRTVQKKAKYVCLAEKKCPVDKRRRNRCQFCRFQKCLAVGMVKEVVRSDSLKGRRGRLPTKSKSPNQPQAVPLIPLIHTLVRAHLETTTDMPQLKFTPDFSAEKENLKSLLDSVSLTYKSGRAWLGKISVFSEISKEDRDILAMSSCLDYFLLKLAYRLKIQEETITLPDGTTYYRNQCVGLVGQILLSAADFSLVLERADIDVQSFACLLTLSVIADRRHGLREPHKVMSSEAKVTDSLRDHCTYDGEAQQKPRMYSRALSLLPDIRALGQRSLRGIRSRSGLNEQDISQELAFLIYGKRTDAHDLVTAQKSA